MIFDILCANQLNNFSRLFIDDAKNGSSEPFFIFGYKYLPEAILKSLLVFRYSADFDHSGIPL